MEGFEDGEERIPQNLLIQSQEPLDSSLKNPVTPKNMERNQQLLHKYVNDLVYGGTDRLQARYRTGGLS